MRSIFALVSAFLSIVPALGAPADVVSGTQLSGDKGTGRYIVKLKDGAVQSESLAALSGVTSLNVSAAVTSDWDDDFFNGFAGNFNDETLNAMRSHLDVEYVEEDGVVSIDDVETEAWADADADAVYLTQTDAPWGLQRISQNPRVRGFETSFDYRYSYNSGAGKGVNVYVIDTGINIANVDFGGRARLGASFASTTNDGHGHGTHCAGTIGGTRWGVAKNANLIGVKVLGDDGKGDNSVLVSGINWVASDLKKRVPRPPSVASISIGSDPSKAIDDAVTALVNLGVHVVVSAGNKNVDASGQSPARVPTVITVGAADINDQKASFSNFGPGVDIFAPGVTIMSDWIGSTTATNILSGTSMSTPHVSGLIATLITQTTNLTPASMAVKIKSLAIKGRMGGLPPALNTPNLLARNDAP
ncbi:peptidase 1 [Auriscalpium vulgare]|uniref:Peptidase 1 n=1 Tax=Auriscalpium vulgare TaxID=40419 RepID=A0ACB8SCB3_9AGAM|nr:peptidase 1 [Auriscalpium vulgare]